MSHNRHQKYWQQFLLPDEKIIHTFGVSDSYLTLFWILPTIMLSIIVIYLATINIILGLPGVVVFLGALLPIIYLRYFVHYSITDQRVMAREGILYKKFITADLSSVTDITINEGFFERVLAKTGSVGINTAGSNIIELHFRHVKKPMLIRGDIYKHQNNTQRGANGAFFTGVKRQIGRV